MTKFAPNKDQRKAIEFGIDTPLKVVAGAGTGKTEVLAQRFVWIAEKHKISPFSILALTFTTKAAAEMRNRIIEELLQRKLINRSERPLLLWIGNFHSICHRLLRQNALTAGLDPSFAVIEEAEQRTILGECVNEFLNKKLDAGANPERFEDLMIERVDGFTQSMVRVINRLKANFIDRGNIEKIIGAKLREQYRLVEENLTATISNTSIHANTRNAAERRLESLPAQGAYENLLFDAAHKIYAEYQDRLSKQNLLDFNDLIFCAYRLLKADTSLQRRFGYILVDEFQDTDTGQYKLLSLLSDNFKNVTVVCDKKQAIYEWREARIKNIDEFPGKTINLYENYRSYAEILDSANLFIAQTMSEEKPLKPALKGGRGQAGKARVKMFLASDKEEEAEFVACEIVRQLEGEYEPDQIAILMRSVLASGPYEDALRNREIPYQVVGGCGFYDLGEIKDLIALLKLIVNPFNDLSMVRILQSPLVGLSDATVYELCRSIEPADAGIYEVIKNSQKRLTKPPRRVYERLQKFIETIDGLATAQWSHTIGELISEVLDRTDYLKYLASLEGPRGARFHNISRLYKRASLFEERNPGYTLEGFLGYLETAMAGETGFNSAGTGNAVQIMTVHQAKGLEFPVVFIVNLKSKAFPLGFRSAGFGYDEDFGLFTQKLPNGTKIIRYDGGYGIGIKESLKERQYKEENRIMYVAMTRARNLLYLTTSESEAGKADAFFGGIGDFARDVGHPGVEAVAFTALPATVFHDSTTAHDIPDLQEIKEMAAKVIQRTSRVSAPTIIPDITERIVLSYSRLALFRQCPMKYALRYLYNLPLSPHEESLEENHRHASAFAIGNLLHATLMHYHRRRKSDEHVDALEILKSISRDFPKEIIHPAKEMLVRYLGTPLSKVNTLYEEQEFHWRIEHGSRCILFAGTVDRIHREGESLKIVDYKTGAPDEVGHRLQLGIYKLAMESVLGERNIIVSDFYLSDCREIEHTFTDAQLGDILEGIIRDATKICDRNFSLDETQGIEDRNCAICGYKLSCPHGQNERL